MSVTCPYCGDPAKLVSGDVVYPRNTGLKSKNFWMCAPCGAYVGCHPRSKSGKGLGDGITALGMPANKALRSKRSQCHDLFDPEWKIGDKSRNHAYADLAKSLGIAGKDCHIGMFDMETCNRVIKLFRPTNLIKF